jgi:hypothetical protein
MKQTITYIDSKTTKLTLDFTDEDVNLVGETLVKGGESEANGYAPFFEADLRRNNAELFPVPEPIEAPEMPGGDE